MVKLYQSLKLMPNMSAAKEENRKVYELLDDCLRTYKSKFNIVTGNFNAKIGSDSVRG